MSFGSVSAGINSFRARMLQNSGGRQHHDAENSAFCTARTGVGTGKTERSRNFMHDGNRSMQIKKRSDRTKLLEQ